MELVVFKASDNCSKQKDEAVTWFRYVHPRVTSAAWPAKWRPIEFIQLPGETVFVPGKLRRRPYKSHSLPTSSFE